MSLRKATLEQRIREATKEVEMWPAWMRQAARFEGTKREGEKYVGD